jgi:phospholipid/cholesterol/gamma-HCH transport system permease protein
MDFLRDLLRDLLRPVTGVLEFIGGVGYLASDAARQSRKGLLSKQGRKLGWANVWFQANRVGVKAIPIVTLVLLCIGAILALQMAPILKRFGAEATVADIIALAIIRELGPLVSAVVLTGFAGAAIAAELGTMVVSEEVEALEAHAIDPIRFLVVPRVIATTVMMVCIAMVGNTSGILGGMFVGQFFLGIDYPLYFSRTIDALSVKDFITGLIKSAVFGAEISLLACYLGLGVSGGALGVGIATTRTVVLTIVALIFTDLLFTAIFYVLGW